MKEFIDGLRNDYKYWLAKSTQVGVYDYYAEGYASCLEKVIIDLEELMRRKEEESEMLEAFKKMLSNAEMVSKFKESDDIIEYDGEQVEVINVFVPSDEHGNGVRAVFHKGTEELIDLSPVHVCTCHSHEHKEVKEVKSFGQIIELVNKNGDTFYLQNHLGNFILVSSSKDATIFNAHSNEANDALEYCVETYKDLSSSIKTFPRW